MGSPSIAKSRIDLIVNSNHEDLDKIALGPSPSQIKKHESKITTPDDEEFSNRKDESLNESLNESVELPMDENESLFEPSDPVENVSSEFNNSSENLKEA